MSETDFSWFDEDILDERQLGLERKVLAAYKKAPPPPPPPAPKALVADDYDTWAWQTVRGAQDIKGVAHDLSSQVPEIEHLSQDVFDALHQPFPQMRPKERVRKDYQRARGALEELMSTGDYAGLHQMTRMKKLAASMATAAVTRAVAETLAKQNEEQPQGAGEGEEGGSQTQRDELRAAARAAMQEVQQDIQDTQTALSAFGGKHWDKSEANMTLADLEEIRKFANLLLNDPFLRDVLEQIGRMLPRQKAWQRQKVKPGAQEVTGVIYGRNLSRALPEELARLATPETELLFYRDWLRGHLLQTEMRGRKPIAKGPVICVIDESGSMMGANHAWAKAIFAVHLQATCQPQKRDMHLMHFSSGQALKEDAYPKGQGTLQEVIASVRHFFGGGTNFTPWMLRAMDIIRADTYKGADVLLITDGDVSLEEKIVEEWRKLRAEKKFNCVGVLIGAYPDDKARMETICDQSFMLTDLAQDAAALKAMMSI